MSHTYTQLLYHLVFSTKNREPLIDPELKSRLHPFLGGAIRELGGTALLVNGMPDHVHILSILPPTITVSNALREIKSSSSGWVHDTWPQHRRFAWQTGYAAFTVSSSNAEKVRRYIERQEEHHRTRTFQEEFIALLKRHGLSYDERYIWD